MNTLTEPELSIMLTLWEAEEAVPRAYIQKKLSHLGWKTNTFNTYLSRLQDKGFLTSESQGQTYYYRPLVPREAYMEKESSSMLGKLFGGSLKNIAIGCASGKTGKNQIHQIAADGNWPAGVQFMERMVEGGKAVTNHFGLRITYINVLNKMSVSCDCEGVRAAPVTTPDIGIVASTDILAVDQASVDLVYALPESQRHDLVERIETRSGLRQLTYMKELGMGNEQYELITL